MTPQEMIRRRYEISLRPRPEAAATYQVVYVPLGGQQVRAAGSAAKRVSEFKATVHVQDDAIVVNWEKPTSDPEVEQDDFDNDVRSRVRPLHEWIERLFPLVSSIGTWAKELGWSVRQVEKPMSDSEIGDYWAPGLVLQRDMVKIGLELIGRSTPGTEGVVDLYQLPAYDDIASLFFYDHRWHLHSLEPEAPAVETVRETKSKPWSKKTLREVLAEMTRHVA
jgi:hypothetical protein